MLPSKISTERLTLLRLTNTRPSHPHVQLFHENWSNPTATAWSLRGATKSLDESREWMIESLDRFDNYFYAVFARTPHHGGNGEKIWTMRGVLVEATETERKSNNGEEDEKEELGVHIGSVSLRLQHSGPTLPPPPPPPPPRRHTVSPSPEEHEESGEQDVNLRALGYAMFPTAWGRGYGTEANRGLLNAYCAAIRQQRGGKGTSYVEAAVDDENAGSLALIRKLGFECVGWKESEKVWLNGGWREGYWVYGLHIYPFPT
ncbi:GNAT domain-containing protein [Bipolaris maydis]|nr:GNAT domain-containing protein [Bipolaris maydis]